MKPGVGVHTAYDEKDAQVLRIAASDVAAVAGYNEWVDVRELFLGRLLYQDLGHVLSRDAENLGLELEDKEQRSERLLVKAGEGELRAVRARAGDGAAVATVHDARTLRDKALSLVKKAEGNKKLSRDEAKELENDLRHDINTQFGTRNEDVALQVYERRTGTEVFCRNERILVWPFPGVREGDRVPDGAPDPPRELSEGWTKKESRSFKRAEAKRKKEASFASFASAAASCLAAVFPARGELERTPVGHTPFTGGGEVANSNPYYASSRNNGSDCREPVVAGGVRGRDSAAADDFGGDEAPEGTAAGVELLGVRSAPGGGDSGHGDPAAYRLERRQLVPGVPWPEWRGSSAACLRDAAPVYETGGGHEAEVLPAIEGALAGMSIEQEKVEGWAGEPGLWFASSLTPRQRAAVHQAAGELGLRHESVAVGTSGGGTVQLVVWEPEAGAVSRKRPLPPPVSVAAPAEGEAAENPAKRRASAPLPLKIPAAVTLGDDNGRGGGGGAGDSSAGQEAAPGTGESAMARGQPGGARRWTVTGVVAAAAAASAVAASAANETASYRGDKSAAIRGRGRPARKKSFIRPVARVAAAATAAAAPGFLATVDGAAVAAAADSGAFSSAAAAEGEAGGPPEEERQAGVKKDKVEETAVYAWGEGPAAEGDERGSEVAAGEAGEEAVESGGEQEPSVWSRRPSVILPADLIAAGIEPPSHLEGESHGDGLGGAGGDVGIAGVGVSDSSGGVAPVPPGGGDVGGAEGGEGAGAVSGQSLRERRKNACFVVVGAVDGIAEEIADAPEGADMWATRRVVVEVKNRMNAAKDPPPLYDQIQLVTYMLMIGATAGDLVQFVKTGRGARNKGRRAASNGAAFEEATRAAEENVTVSRVELDCRAYHHQRHWEQSVLPRLYAFARMVYRFRGDDLLRWRYLLATPEEQRAMLVECCPYLDSVIPRLSLPQRLPLPVETAAAATAVTASPSPNDGPTAGIIGNKAATESAQKQDTHGVDQESDALLLRPGVTVGHETARTGAVSGEGQPVRPAEAAAVAVVGETVELPTNKRAKGWDGVAIGRANTNQE